MESEAVDRLSFSFGRNLGVSVPIDSTSSRSSLLFPRTAFRERDDGEIRSEFVLDIVSRLDFFFCDAS